MKRQRSWLMAAALCLVALLVVPAVAQQQVNERYNALAVHLGTGPSGQVQVQIAIDRWSTDEEAQHLLTTLENEGPQKLSDELGKQQETGFIRFPGGRTRFPSTRLHYARQGERDGKRVIILATNRPLAFAEVFNQTRSTDYDLSLIELTLEADGSGEGVLAAGVEIGFDKEKNQLTAKNWSSAPIRLQNVRKQQ